MKLYAALFSALLLSSACTSQTSMAPLRSCTAEGRAAIVLSIRDALTGAAAATGATVTAHALTSGQSVDLVGRQTDSVTVVVGTSPGSYDVSVARVGYVTWARTGVSVDSLGSTSWCQPKTVAIDVALQPTQ